jgi:hypothetical protein
VIYLYRLKFYIYEKTIKNNNIPPVRNIPGALGTQDIVFTVVAALGNWKVINEDKEEESMSRMPACELHTNI